MVTESQKAEIGLIVFIIGLIIFALILFFYQHSTDLERENNKLNYLMGIAGSLIIMAIGLYIYFSNRDSDQKIPDAEGNIVKPFSYYLTENNPYTPQQVGSAYLGNVPYDGTGQKIAIISCYKYKNLQRDFDIFCDKYDLPRKTLNIYSYGTATNKGWAIETCLDTQWAHVFAPNAEIYVFQAASAKFTDITYAIQRALSMGVNIVSMSFGSYEYPAVHSIMEPIFANQNALFLAASGDYPEVSYPSSSPNVVSVGGTTMFIQYDGNNNRKVPQDADYSFDPQRYKCIGETDWARRNGTGTGYGISLYFPRPAFQDGHNDSTFRSTPDLSAIAATPNGGGVSVYCNGWYGVQGTSLSCPILAGMMATINSRREGNYTQNEFLTKLYESIPTDLPVKTSSDGVGFVSRNFIEMMI